MPFISAVRISNGNYSPSYIPTAVFVGGTSGIGKAMVEAFAAQTSGRANIVIVGRGEAAAKSIIASLPAPPSPDIKHQFVSCDALELKNVYATSQELLAKLSKINILVLSPGGMAFRREDTAEGHDAGLVLRYYARAKFIDELLPLLQKAKNAGEDAGVMSVLAAAKGGSPDLKDLGLTKWSFVRGMIATGTYNDSMIKVLSDEHPDITFIHIYPGLVDTPAMRATWWLNIITTLIKPLGFVVNPDVSASYMLYPLLSPDFASGGYWLDAHSGTLAFPKELTPEVVKGVWQHTLEVIKTQ